MVTARPLVKNAGSVLSLLPVRNVADGCLVSIAPNTSSKTNQREYWAVVAIDPINFSLMDQGEQDAILAGYRAFLQRLPVGKQISIHVRIQPYHLRPYREKLEACIASNPSQLVRELAREHERFIADLASKRALLERRFYVRVSALPPARGLKGRRLLPEEQFELAKDELNLTVEGLLEDLRRCNLAGHRLDDYELCQYYYECVHFSAATKYPLKPAVFAGLDLPPQAVHLRQIVDDPFAVAEVANSTNAINAGPTPTTLALREETTSAPLVERSAEPDPKTSEPSPAKGEDKTEKKSMPVFRLPRLFSRRNATPGPRRRKKAAQDSEVAPHTTLVELLQPSLVAHQDEFIKVHMRGLTEYCRTNAIIGYPAEVIYGWLDQVLQLDEPFLDIVLYTERLDASKYMEQQNKQLAFYRAKQSVDAQAGRVENPHLAVAHDQVQELRNKLAAQTEHVHHLSLYFTCRASSLDELRQRNDKLVSHLSSMDLDIVDLSLEHLKAWQQVFPDGHDVLKRHKVLETASVVTAFPFASKAISTEPGALVGVAPDGGMVVIDPLSDRLDNGHLVKFARSGAGKSFDEKVTLLRLYLLGYEIIVVDPEDEYLALSKRLAGANIRLSSGRLQINPFDLPHSDNPERNILEEKIQSLLTLFDLLLAEKEHGTLLQREKALLTRAITRIYADRGITSDQSTHGNLPPSMRDLHAILLSGECGQDVFELAPRLERHLEAFPDQTEVELSNRMIVFNIRDLSDELRPVGLYLVTEFVWVRVRSERRPVPRILSIDEAWVLMQFEQGGRFLAAMSRRARKYNLCLRIITQNVEDFLSSENGRTILLNASMKFLMKQDGATIDAVARAMRLSEEERHFLLGCARGQGLYYVGLSHVPLQVIASPAEHSIANTNPQELLREELESAARAEQQAAARARREAIAVEQRNNEFSVVFPGFYQPGAGDEHNNGHS